MFWGDELLIGQDPPDFYILLSSATLFLLPVLTLVQRLILEEHHAKHCQNFEIRPKIVVGFGH